MKKLKINKEWRFTFENMLDELSTMGLDKYAGAAGAPARFYEHSNWETVDIPHDWSLSLQRTLDADMNAGAYPNTHYHKFKSERHSDIKDIYSIGWYRKEFTPDPTWQNKRVFVLFDGIFRNSDVWVNGVYLDHHSSGYTGFKIELTDHLVFGELNSIAVRADSEEAEGWWYEGAGIYRSVFFLIGEPVYFKHEQTVIQTELDGTVHARCVLVNDTDNTVSRTVQFAIKDRSDTVATSETEVEVLPYSEKTVEAELCVKNPKLWSPETPYLYTLDLCADDETESTRFGIRTVGFDADNGFILNGKPYKVRGACVHQDFGGVGVALTANLNAYKIHRLKDMGVNAYRCAHHAPTPELLDACDELGMLVMNETRTFGTSPEAIRQLTALIERDRNRPCVFIWTLGNEEFNIQDIEWSARLMQKMTRIAKALDPTRPVTYGGCNGGNDTGANGVAEVRGVNYIRNGEDDWFDKYHLDHPDQPIIGTEESSYVLSRGGAVNDIANGELDSTGNVTMPWGSTPRGWVKFTEDRPYFAGSFMWTGFDYRGETNPFYYSTTSSSFGTLDLCGMEKPPFYYYKAWWTNEPVLKLAPHWNHREGDTVTVPVFTNCEEITLSLNGKALETRKIERFDAPLFEIPYEPGTISVSGKRGDEILYDEMKTAEDVSEIRQKLVLKAENDEDVAIYQLEAFDKNGVFCPLASDTVSLDLEGGTIIGIGNGDPKSLYRERLPLLEESFPIRTFSCDYGVFTVPEKAPNVMLFRTDRLEREGRRQGYEEDFRIVAHIFEGGTAPLQKTEYTAKIQGAESFSYVEFERLGGTAEVYLNGVLIGDNRLSYGSQCKNYNRPYRFLCNFKKGENILTVVSERRETDAPSISGYVKIGKQTAQPWKVNLHYGKACVFVKTATPDKMKLTAEIK